MVNIDLLFWRLTVKTNLFWLLMVKFYSKPFDKDLNGVVALTVTFFQFWRLNFRAFDGWLLVEIYCKS